MVPNPNINEEDYKEIDEDDDSSLEGYISDTPLSEDLKPNYPPLDESFDGAVIVTNLPKVPSTKVEKLTKVVVRLYSKIGTLAVSADGSFNGVHMPFDTETSKTAGVAFVQYTNKEDAQKAVEVTSDYQLDKSHTLRTMLYSNAMELRDVPAEFNEPEPAPFVERPDTTSFLTDDGQRDEYVIRHGSETVVLWSDGKTEPQIDYDGAREKKAGIHWCDYYVQWSPRGSFLATLLPAKGVILWGGAKYEKLGRFPAPGVQFVLFSPQENYLLTSNDNRNDPQAIKIFHITTQKLLRTFPLYPTDFLNDEQKKALRHGNLESVPPPPPFQWSYHDEYIARMGRDLISIYSLPKMKLLDSRSLAAEGIHEFQWSPRDSVLAYWAPEVGNAPAHVDLIHIPSRKPLRQKNLFNVTKCSMAWQSDGDYLGVKVTRHTKSKKTLYNNIELFRVRDGLDAGAAGGGTSGVGGGGIPVEMLDVKDAVMAFAWEPRGSKFAMIHAENPNASKVSVSFYDMMKKTEVATVNKLVGGGSKKDKNKTEIREIAELNKIETLEGKQCNCLFWSPAGSVALLASLGDQASGSLEFYDVETKNLVMKEHYRANEVLWDPSGRAVATAVVQPIGGGHFKFAMDNGYILWSFQGKQIHQASYETFHQFQWRPRERLLKKQAEKQVIKNIKKYEREFDKADREEANRRKFEATKVKRQQRARFRERMDRLRQFREEQKMARMELWGGYDSQDEDNYVLKEVEVETILSTKEETVQL